VTKNPLSFEHLGPDHRYGYKVVSKFMELTRASSIDISFRHFPWPNKQSEWWRYVQPMGLRKTVQVCDGTRGSNLYAARKWCDRNIVETLLTSSSSILVGSLARPCHPWWVPFYWACSCSSWQGTAFDRKGCPFRTYPHTFCTSCSSVFAWMHIDWGPGRVPLDSIADNRRSCLCTWCCILIL